jgi:hypothetical protein
MLFRTNSRFLLGDGEENRALQCDENECRVRLIEIAEKVAKEK